jgi:hypothetical protein
MSERPLISVNVDLLLDEEPVTNTIADGEIDSFVGPMAVYVVHSPNKWFGPYAGAYRAPLDSAMLADIREWTQADVSGPFPSPTLAMAAIGRAPDGSAQSACARFTAAR